VDKPQVNEKQHTNKTTYLQGSWFTASKLFYYLIHLCWVYIFVIIFFKKIISQFKQKYFRL